MSTRIVLIRFVRHFCLEIAFQSFQGVEKVRNYISNATIYFSCADFYLRWVLLAVDLLDFNIGTNTIQVHRVYLLAPKMLPICTSIATDFIVK